MLRHQPSSKYHRNYTRRSAAYPLVNWGALTLTILSLTLILHSRHKKLESDRVNLPSVTSDRPLVHPQSKD
ncbi:hypothetical protein [Calothrix sp. NIES-2100]|uniref:hypothetical protein n=1 Tax=Calothrix sp. NIES-2100 TaxID=1954172 RepID=UPI0030DDD59A